MFNWLRGKESNKGKRVFVGVSGGVDSSVSAGILKEEGYDVVGVFIRTWQPDFIECTWKQERRDAMRVCAHLNIPFVELNLEDAYREGVAEYMIAEYRAGRTPNPDVMCNKEVKFGAFFDWAMKQGADYVATGHYAQVINGQLAQGLDGSKDQSYFLWTLTPEILKKTLFPVGSKQKSKVRTIAQRLNLPTARKKDSQGICFIGEVDMKEFLSHYIESVEGDVVDESENVIGKHDGALFYTLGERHGFTITIKTPQDKPYYVVAKDIKQNRIVVSQNVNNRVGKHEVALERCVWQEVPKSDKKYLAVIRYHGKPMEVTIDTHDQKTTIRFTDPDFSLASGQSVVVYDGIFCVGGGIVI